MLIGQVRENGNIDLVLDNLSIYSGMRSFLSQSAICCIAATVGLVVV